MSDTGDSGGNLVRYLLTGAVTTVGILLGVIYKTFQGKVHRLEANQEKILKAVPTVALEKGLSLMTCQDCTSLRAACGNTSDVKAIKGAVLKLVSHSPHIPQEEKDAISLDFI